MSFLLELPKKVYTMMVFWAMVYIVSMSINLLAFPLSPVIALISLFTGRDNIPAVFNWWLTHDNHIYGDEGHLVRWPLDGSKWTDFKRRTAWLWRNKGYQFDYQYLGRPIGHHLTNHGNPNTSSEGTAGWLFQYDEHGTWEFYLVWVYPFNQDKCLRIRFGWKLDDLSVGTGRRMMLATSIGIWKTFRR